jgi:quinate dehydrogenase (quinone)
MASRPIGPIVEPESLRPSGILEKIFGTLLAATGMVLGLGGGWLVLLGGSIYYLMAGAMLAIAGILLFRRSAMSFVFFALVYAGTVAWSLYEAGWNFWPMVPRLGPFLVMTAIMASFWARLNPRRRSAARALAIVHAACCLAGVVAMFVPHGAIRGVGSRPAAPWNAPASNWEWRNYGGTTGATHFVPFGQIRPDNVGRLKVAWSFRTGEINDSPDMEATPIQIGNSLYFCTSHNRIFSLDADTGRKNWSFDPRVDAKGTWNRCRGVAYFEAPGLARSSPGSCMRRIIATTVDARMFALDADTGLLCPDFGKAGFVDLNAGLGPMKPGWYYPTSAPLVARGRIIVGGWVSDNQSVDEPGGVVRARSAKCLGCRLCPVHPEFLGYCHLRRQAGLHIRAHR